MENCYSVYKHTFPNGKVYIGMTSTTVERRWKNNGTGYLSKHKNGSYTQPLIAHAILKYGWDNVAHEVLFSNLSQDDAIKMEKDLILEYKSTDIRFGYNIREGGYSGIPSDEHKNRLSESRKGEKSYWYGKTFPEDVRKKLSELRMGTKLSEDHRRRISEGMKGRACLEETKKKISDANRGKAHSDEHKRKISDAMKKQILCVETGVVYESLSEASKITGVSLSRISKVCNAGKGTAGGFHWQFYNTTNITAA